MLGYPLAATQADLTPAQRAFLLHALPEAMGLLGAGPMSRATGQRVPKGPHALGAQGIRPGLRAQVLARRRPGDGTGG